MIILIAKIGVVLYSVLHGTYSIEVHKFFKRLVYEFEYLLRLLPSFFQREIIL
jgi:hypothetical protein